MLLRRKAEGSYLLCRSHTLTALYRVRGPASRSLFTLCERSLLKDKCVIVKSKSLVALNTSPIYCNTHQKSMIQIIAVENCLMNTTDAEACMKYSFTNVKIFTITRCFYSKSSEKLVFSFQALFWLEMTQSCLVEASYMYDKNVLLLPPQEVPTDQPNQPAEAEHNALQFWKHPARLHPPHLSAVSRESWET